VGHIRSRINTHLVDVVQGLADSLAFGYGRQQAGAAAHAGSDLAGWERRLGGWTACRAGCRCCWSIWRPSASCGWPLGGWMACCWRRSRWGSIAAFEAITPLALAGQHLGKEMAAAGRVLEIIENVPAVPQPAQPASRHQDNFDLAMVGVTFRYAPGERPVLVDFSLNVPQGARVLITGESGVGKSSLINVLLRLAPIEPAASAVGGVDLSRLAHEEVVPVWRDDAAHPPVQHHHSLENIRIGRKSASHAEIEAAARAAQIHDFSRPCRRVMIPTWVKGARCSAAASASGWRWPVCC
jgi:ATP-binding cassette, subfamily C, bacterial CydC